jgi:hypothetical protein
MPHSPVLWVAAGFVMDIRLSLLISAWSIFRALVADKLPEVQRSNTL